jgi:hypothetical protein
VSVHRGEPAVNCNAVTSDIAFSIFAGGKTLNAIPIIFRIGVVTSVFGLTVLI